VRLPWATSSSRSRRLGVAALVSGASQPARQQPGCLPPRLAQQSAAPPPWGCRRTQPDRMQRCAHAACMVTRTQGRRHAEQSSPPPPHGPPAVLQPAGGGAAAGPMRSDMDPCAASVLQILSAGELQHIDQGLHVNDVSGSAGGRGAGSQSGRAAPPRGVPGRAGSQPASRLREQQQQPPPVPRPSLTPLRPAVADRVAPGQQVELCGRQERPELPEQRGTRLLHNGRGVR